VNYRLDENGSRVLDLPDGQSYYVVFSGRESITGEWPEGTQSRVRFGKRITEAYRAITDTSDRALIANLAIGRR
jgi:hypothetical protein